MSEKNPPSPGVAESVPADRSSVQEAIERKVRVDRENRELSRHLDPTRYGDWEKNGQCIDF